MKTKSKYTGYKDEKDNKIFVGDTLKSEWGYKIIVVESEDENYYYGKLICNDKHSCKDIPYSLNNGKGYIKVNI